MVEGIHEDWLCEVSPAWLRIKVMKFKTGEGEGEQEKRREVVHCLLAETLGVEVNM